MCYRIPRAIIQVIAAQSHIKRAYGRSVVTKYLRRIALHIAALLFLLVAGYAGGAYAQRPHPCPDDATWNPPISPAGCTKEIQVWNNTGTKIYVVIQGSIQQQAALGNCPVNPAGGGGGDAWLQRALNDVNNCHPVNNDYYVYLNPKTGIAPGGFVSVNVPWWSRTRGGADKYIDWWRAGRVHVFDDQVALDDSYTEAQKLPTVQFATAAITCKQRTGNACKDVEIYQVAAGALSQIATQSPHQLNEYTFADVLNSSHNFALDSLNQNYNVSNVDQVYLPLAMEPIREPPAYAPDIGYSGTTIDVTTARTRMAAFTGATGDNTANPTNWPIYNNPLVNGQPRYPTAGIRVPSAYDMLIYYMQPYYFRAPLPHNTPVIIPSTPPELVKNMISQWSNCTTTGDNCSQVDQTRYKQINNVFLDNYKSYIDGCTTQNCVPPYLMPGTGLPLQPENMYAYLAYIYGWVPFNNNFANKALPTPDQPPAQNGNAPIRYIAMQYNYQNLANEGEWFNPYTQFIHGDAASGGLGANAYAFSIDDAASVQNNAGEGLIFAIGGDNGLPNKTQVPPPVPAYYPYYSFVIGLGSPGASGAQWAKYGICSSEATVQFPNLTGGYSIGVNPELYTFPCTITLTDTKNKKYQIEVKKAASSPPFWPLWSKPSGFDTDVVACPTATGVVPPAEWCMFTNETTTPGPPPFYNLSVRVPLSSVLGGLRGFGPRP